MNEQKENDLTKEFSLKINQKNIDGICFFNYSEKGSWNAVLKKLCESELPFILTLIFNKGSGKQHSNGKLISMIIISSLLFLYSSAVLTSFVLYKVGSKWFFWFC